ncbi:MAG TPA: glycoside hydrolase family 28 protein [Arachidicoccus sp.]|nr:glycoside hydrolase family 28 protein [Arachidicoccus sp.]
MKKSFFVVLTFLITLIGNPSLGQQSKYSWENLPVIERPIFKKDTFNIVDFGAKDDGLVLNTGSINQAISACSEKGGGVVLIPPGIWETGPIVLKSNVDLHISRSALLQFTDDKRQYHLVEGNFEGKRAVRNQSPISGTGLENIAITGEGIIDGHGEVWRAMGKSRVTEKEWKNLIKGGVLSDDGKTWYPSQSYAEGVNRVAAGTVSDNKAIKDYQPMKDFFRPNLLVLTNCKYVLLEHVTFQNSPAWCLHTLLCEQVTFNNVKVRNEANAQNGDGMDIESCRYVKVENCTLDCGDDGICIKSGKDEEGRKRARPSCYIVIRNNTVYKAHGGFVIGSEMSGGAHDIFVSDCLFIGTSAGLRFKTVRGRGAIVENIFIRNIGMRSILGDAITFDMYYFTKAPILAQTGEQLDIPEVSETTPQFRNFYIENIVCDGAARAMFFRGLPEMNLKEIHVDGARIVSKEGIELVDASKISLKNISLSCKSTSSLIHIENSSKIQFDHLISNQPTTTLFTIDGNRANEISLSHSPQIKTLNKNLFRYGAKEKALTIIE